jgi:hypothetical protein
MRGNVLYRQYEIEWKELESFNRPARRNNFFELIYIIEGTGTQTVNKNRFKYRRGNLILIHLLPSYSSGLINCI